MYEAAVMFIYLLIISAITTFVMVLSKICASIVVNYLPFLSESVVDWSIYLTIGFLYFYYLNGPLIDKMYDIAGLSNDKD